MPNTTRRMFDQKIAPEHITQGSPEAYMVAPASSSRPCEGVTLRRAFISAWLVQSPLPTMSL